MILFKVINQLTANFIKTVFFYVGILLLYFSCNSVDLSKEKEKNPTSPNFILILADDQGWNGTSVKMINENELSKSDFYETPNIERIAEKGVIFSNAYASAPVCAPSRYSIQFGQSPARLQMIRVGMNTEHIDHDSEITIPKQLKKNKPKL